MQKTSKLNDDNIVEVTITKDPIKEYYQKEELENIIESLENDIAKRTERLNELKGYKKLYKS